MYVEIEVPDIPEYAKGFLNIGQNQYLSNLFLTITKLTLWLVLMFVWWKQLLLSIASAR